MHTSFRKRIKTLQGLMDKAKLKSVLINSPYDILYYTGLKPEFDNETFLVVDSKPTFFAHRIQNDAEQFGIDVVWIKDAEEIAKKLKGPVGFDALTLNAYLYTKLIKKVKLKPALGVIEGPRAVKGPEEIEKIKTAAKITKIIFSGFWDLTGRTEADVAREILAKIIRAKARASFNPVVASGKNSYYIHTKPSEKKIMSNDLVVMDFGAKFEGYCSDMTRMFCKKPDLRQKKVLEDAKNIQSSLIDMVSDGVEIKDVQKEYERIAASKRYSVMHGWGHSIGLETHEHIFGKLRAGMVVTVEPGIYIKNFGGCRYEDMVIIRKGGRPVVI